MLTESDLRELLDYSSPHPVLSLYLNTEPAQGNADAYRLRLRGMLKDLDLPRDIERIEEFFAHEYDWTGRSVAVFSCAADDYFRAFPLSVTVRSRVRVSDHPHFKPLADIWDAYGGYGVILIDKQGARLFHFHLGELEEQQGTVGEEVKHMKHGSITGKTGNTEELVDRNMRASADFAVRFLNANHIRRVLIGGTEENTKALFALLPKTWQSMVVGTFPMAMTASHVDVLTKAMQIGLEAEARAEHRMIDAAITAAAKGTGGAVGVENVLSAVSSHRVQTLLFNEGFISQGIRCQNCGFVTPHKLDVCPICGAKTESVHDIVDLAVRAVLKSGGDVEVIHHSPELERVGKIAAVLRY